MGLNVYTEENVIEVVGLEVRGYLEVVFSINIENVWSFLFEWYFTRIKYVKLFYRFELEFGFE